MEVSLPRVLKQTVRLQSHLREKQMCRRERRCQAHTGIYLGGIEKKKRWYKKNQAIFSLETLNTHAIRFR